MEICIPKKVLPSKHRKLPWLTKRIVQAMRQRNALFKRAMRSRADSDYAKYREARNNVVSNLRSAKSAYFHKPSNSKKFWQAVKCLNKNCSSIPTLTHNNVSYESDEDKAAVLNSHLISCFNNTVEPLQVPDEETYISHQVPVDLSNIMCSEEDVEAMLHSLDTTKANGKDGISARMLKETADAIAPSIRKRFTLSIQLCHVPHAWKDAIVMPIPKKQGAMTPTKFRPISLLPILSKVLERHFYLLISEHISDHSPLSTCQFSFQSGKSTISALLSVTQDWFRQLEKRQEIGAVFFDLKKSF